MDETKPMKKIILISPPFSYGYLPSIGLSTLKPMLEKEKLPHELLYANLVFKREISPDLYEDLCERFKLLEYAEFIFAPFAFPEAREKHNAYRKILEKGDKCWFDKTAFIMEKTEEYLLQVSDYITGQSPSIIYLECGLKQLTASIAIANKVKEKDPSIITVMGGCSCLGSMGEALGAITPGVDYILQGDNENRFIDLCKTLRFGKKGESEKIISCPPVSPLDDLPFPDFDDYYTQLEALSLQGTSFGIPIETSRGCWWGEKSHCIFCGHQEDHVAYHQKSAKRAREEYTYLIDKYKPVYIFPRDNIMPADYIDGLFKHLRLPGTLKKIFAEVKPDLDYGEIKILADRKFKIQVGLESFNNHILKILKKGVTTAKNILFMKNCLKAGLNIHWNFLHSVPGETEEDYRDMVDSILPFITHLQPPADLRPLYIQRFSPIFEEARAFGIKNLRPYDVYQHIYPDSADIKGLALFFEGEYETPFQQNKNLKEKFFSIIKRWQELWKQEKKPELSVKKMNDSSPEIVDTRQGQPGRSISITEKHMELLRQADREKGLSEIGEKEFYELVDYGILIKANRKYISLINPE